jgi:hypothetical protein
LAGIVDKPVGTLAYRKIQGLEADEVFSGLVRHSLFAEICARVYGAHCSVSIFRAMVMNKPAGQGTHLPWHQDGGLVWELDRDPEVTVWVALDPATRANGCLQVISGSHRLGLLTRQGSTLSTELAARHCPEDAIEFLELAAGEALVLHNFLLHRSGVNATPAPRRGFTACYMDGRTVNRLTGQHFYTVFGEPWSDDDMPAFERQLRSDNGRLRAAMAEAERYAQSLAVDNAELRRSVEEATRYARSLEAALAAQNAAKGG